MDLLLIFVWLVVEISFSDSLFAEPVRFEPVGYILQMLEQIELKGTSMKD